VPGKLLAVGPDVPSPASSPSGACLEAHAYRGPVEGTGANDPHGGVETASGAAGIRVLVSFAIGIAAFGVAWLATPWQGAALIGWNVAATVFNAWILFTVAGMDAEATARHAAIEDPSQRPADLTLILASVTSLVGVGLSLLKASDTEGLEKAVIVAIASASVILSWATVHNVFTLRYARLYYAAGGGIDFNGDRAPTYTDFAYLAFTIGMTYQVSDTSIASKAIRRTALRHAYMSYLFGTVVVAMTINVVAGLFNR
jgi:uncharacterized membrane protein